MHILGITISPHVWLNRSQSIGALYGLREDTCSKWFISFRSHHGVAFRRIIPLFLLQLQQLVLLSLSETRSPRPERQQSRACPSYQYKYPPSKPGSPTCKSSVPVNILNRVCRISQLHVLFYFAPCPRGMAMIPFATFEMQVSIA